MTSSARSLLLTFTRWAAAVVALLAACAPGSSEDPAREAPAAAVERLISDPEQLLKPSPAIRQGLAEMRSNPRPYLAAMSARFATAPTAGDAAARRYFEEFSAAAYVVGRLDAPEGTALLAHWIALVDAADDASLDPASSSVVRRARASLLLALGTSCPDEVAARVLTRLPSLQRPDLVGATNYLLLACRRQPGLRAQLQELHDDPSSSLHGDPDLARVLAALENAR